MKTDIEKMLSNFESAKQFLRLELVNERSIHNGRVTRPLCETGDIRMVCKIAVAEDYGKAVQVEVTGQMVKVWGISEDELFSAANKSCAEARKPVIRLMQEMINLEIETDSPDYTPMYVLTNEHLLHGAACICYEGILDKIREMVGCGYYILPSSVHEVLILPGEFNLRTGFEYKKIVEQINATGYVGDDYLSDTPMYYDGTGLYAV